MPDNTTFEAHIKIRVKANNKMDASRKIRIMFLSSAVGPRDYEISEFQAVEEHVSQND